MSTEEESMTHAEFTTGTFARISGKVQGVNYRSATKRKADELAVVGWVRNTDDDAVEMLVAGEGAEVDSLLNWCRRGPKRAEVDSVETRAAAAEELTTLPSSGFTVRR